MLLSAEIWVVGVVAGRWKSLQQVLPNKPQYCCRSSGAENQKYVTSQMPLYSQKEYDAQCTKLSLYFFFFWLSDFPQPRSKHWVSGDKPPTFPGLVHSGLTLGPTTAERNGTGGLVNHSITCYGWAIAVGFFQFSVIIKVLPEMQWGGGCSLLSGVFKDSINNPKDWKISWKVKCRLGEDPMWLAQVFLHGRREWRTINLKTKGLALAPRSLQSKLQQRERKRWAEERDRRGTIQGNSKAETLLKSNSTVMK